MEESVQTNVRLPKNIKERLDAEAESSFRSTTQHLTAILADYFQRKDLERELAARAEAAAQTQAA